MTLVTQGTRRRKGERMHHAHGMCHSCYVKDRSIPKPLNLRACKDCDRLMVSGGTDRLGRFVRHAAYGLCDACYTRERRRDAAIHPET